MVNRIRIKIRMIRREITMITVIMQIIKVVIIMAVMTKLKT